MDAKTAVLSATRLLFGGLVATAWLVGLSASSSAVSANGGYANRDSIAAKAEEETAESWLNVREVTPIDLDQDGRNDAIRIFGYWLTSVGDTVTIYGDGQEMPSTADYRAAENFSHSTWIFQIGGTEGAALILRFRTEGDTKLAYLWDDQDGDGQVRWHLDATTVEVDESPHWTMKLWADGEWTRPDGTLNYNVHSLLDGCGFCNMTATGDEYPDEALAAMRIDGQPDFAVDFTDGDEDGIPDSSTWRMLAAVPESAFGLSRFNADTNPLHRRPAAREDYIFWPLLAPSASEPKGNVFDFAPYIPIKWPEHKIGLLTLAGYPIEEGYLLNSYAQAPDNADPIYANFENPMAYYDLASDHDGRPELHIRLGYGRAHDPATFGGRLPIPISEIRYSWNQSNDPGLIWTYKLGLLGAYEVTETTRIGAFNILVPPPDELPSWCVNKSWDVRTFVATEQGGEYQSSEGIYEWAPAVGGDYIAGLTSSPPSLSQIANGLRGEYSLRPGKAELYFSPVDRRLHLTGANAGVWQIDDDRQLRFLNLTGGDVLDGWQLWTGGLLVQQLYRVPGGFLYSDETETLYLKSDLPDALFRTLPPTNHEDWLILGAQLTANGADSSIKDLRAMFLGLGGTPVRVASGPLAEFRPLPDGARFVVRVDDGQSRESLTALTGRTPTSGPQVVSIINGAWQVEPAVFANPVVALSVDAGRAREHTAIRVSVTNDGTIDVHGANVTVTALAPDGQTPTLLATRPLDLDGGATFAFDVDWWPPSDGTWQIAATVSRTAGGDPRSDQPVLLGQEDSDVVVQPVPAPPLADQVRFGWSAGMMQRLALLGGLIVLAGAVTGAMLRTRSGAP